MNTTKTGILVIDNNNIASINDLLNNLSINGGGLCIILSEVQRGFIYKNCPKNVRLLDLRYGGISILANRHPRQEGIWPQYSFLKTALARNVVISDSIYNDTKLENFKSEKVSPPPPISLKEESLTSAVYSNSHSHYQNLLCETFNHSTTTNAISIWGDSAALVDQSKSWGGFFSARSFPLKMKNYSPTDTINQGRQNFDAQLVGVEVDTINYGLDWTEMNPTMPKYGVQIVGFGKKNTSAIEIRTEDSDDRNKKYNERNGLWSYGLLIWNGLGIDSTAIKCDSGEIKRGIDFSLTSCTEGAVVIKKGTRSSGINFEWGTGGKIYSDMDRCLTIEGGKEGIRITINENDYIHISSDCNIDISDNLIKAIKKAILG